MANELNPDQKSISNSNSKEIEFQEDQSLDRSLDEISSNNRAIDDLGGVITQFGLWAGCPNV